MSYSHLKDDHGVRMFTLLTKLNVPRLVAPPGGRRLIVDWETALEYVYRDDGEDPHVVEHGCSGIGEVAPAHPSSAA